MVMDGEKAKLDGKQNVTEQNKGIMTIFMTFVLIYSDCQSLLYQTKGYVKG